MQGEGKRGDVTRGGTIAPHYHDTHCTKFFDVALTTTLGQKLECFKLTGNDMFISNLKIW